MVLDLVRQLGPWSWMVAGLILLGLELIAPGNVVMWFGIAALITGGLALMTDFGWQVDFLVFIVLSVVLVYAGRRVFARSAGWSEQPLLNQRAQRHVGGIHALAEPIVGGHGRIRIDDTNWRVTGPDLPSGTRVRVTAADGPVLSVVKADT